MTRVVRSRGLEGPERRRSFQFGIMIAACDSWLATVAEASGDIASSSRRRRRRGGPRGIGGPGCNTELQVSPAGHRRPADGSGSGSLYSGERSAQ